MSFIYISIHYVGKYKLFCKTNQLIMSDVCEGLELLHV